MKLLLQRWPAGGLLPVILLLPLPEFNREKDQELVLRHQGRLLRRARREQGCILSSGEASRAPLQSVLFA